MNDSHLIPEFVKDMVRRLVSGNQNEQWNVYQRLKAIENYCKSATDSYDNKSKFRKRE